jgi:hypothetical protein
MRGVLVQTNGRVFFAGMSMRQSRYGNGMQRASAQPASGDVGAAL